MSTKVELIAKIIFVPDETPLQSLKPNWSLERSTVQLILQEIPLKNRETSNPEAFGIKARDERHPEKLQDSLEKEDLR